MDPKNNDAKWRNDFIQFPRLLAELEHAGAFTPEVVARLCEEMDIEVQDLNDLQNRAEMVWQGIKFRMLNAEPLRPPVIVLVDGGLVQDVVNIPKGTEVHIRDYDIEGADEEELIKGSNGEQYTQTIYGDES